MNYKKLLPLFAIALLTHAAFTACSTDTPKTEKKDGKKDPHTDGSTGATKKPGTPVTPTPADPKENLPALREGEVRIAVPQAGGLEAALKGKDLSKVRILLLTSGAINQADCDFIRYQMKALEELDISRVAFGIGDDEYGPKEKKLL